VNAKKIRYYERIGLFPKVGREVSGYRDYNEADVNRLRFIGRARHLGFSLASVRDLLNLWSDRDRSSEEVRTAALAYVAELERRAVAVADMRRMLRNLSVLRERPAR
jgi:MerR family copper efflux transcriptional regulator